jgi:ethanolamine utilization cobalamin adenosyltransferase
MKARNNPIHTVFYEDQRTALRERVDTIMCEIQKLSIEANYQSLISWFNDVISSMKEVEVNKSEANRRLYISDSPFF